MTDQKSSIIDKTINRSCNNIDESTSTPVEELVANNTSGELREQRSSIVSGKLLLNISQINFNYYSVMKKKKYF